MFKQKKQLNIFLSQVLDLKHFVPFNVVWISIIKFYFFKCAVSPLIVSA